MPSHPFRFGLQAFEAATAQDWFDVVRRTEDLGYSTLFSSDHYFGPGAVSDATGHRPLDVAPLTSIVYAAARSQQLRVGCRVFAVDYHHPVVLAKETATLDFLSGGRLEVGLGAGWVREEYDAMGVPMAGAGTRVAKVAEYAELLRAHWSGEQIDQHGEYVRVTGFAGRPLPARVGGPKLMIGGGAPKILGVAGRYADIVSLNFNNASGKLGASSIASSGAAETEQKLEWIRAGAGERFDEIELEIAAYFVAVGERATDQIDAMAARFGVDPAALATHPHGLFGSVEQICDTLVERRERYGISYVTVAQRYLDTFAPIVARLAGT